MRAKKNIFVIEDNYALRSSIIQLLEANNFSAVGCADGESAIKVIEQVMPDLIICDIMLPGMDGYEVLEYLQKKFINEDPIPFIYLTAKVDYMDIRKGMNLGADDYITKPFRVQDLLESINTRLTRFDNFTKNKPAVKTDIKNAKDENRLNINQGIIISDKTKTGFIKLDNIAMIAASGDYSNVTLQNGEKILVQKSLKYWETILPEKTFYRTHRSYIVNIDQIEEITPWFKRSYKIKLKGSEEDVFISERYVIRLKKILNN